MLAFFTPGHLNNIFMCSDGRFIVLPCNVKQHVLVQRYVLSLKVSPTKLGYVRVPLALPVRNCSILMMGCYVLAGYQSSKEEIVQLEVHVIRIMKHVTCRSIVIVTFFFFF